MDKLLISFIVHLAFDIVYSYSVPFHWNWIHKYTTGKQAGMHKYQRKPNGTSVKN